MKGEKRNCLFLECWKLPEKIQEVIREWLGYNRDCCLIASRRSEFDVEAYREGMKSVEDYWQDQVKTNGFKGSLDEFIKSYHLEFDVWVIKQKFDLTDIDDIIIEIG